MNAEPLPALEKEIDHIFALQQNYRKKNFNPTLAERRQRLQKIERWIVAHQLQIRQALYQDFHKPAEETDLTEIFIALSEVRHALRHLKSWMKPQKVKRTLAVATAKAWIRYQPRGVVLIISPWNFPFHLTVVPLISALAAGNSVVLKPSEYVPHTASLLQQMVQDLFEPQEVAIFLGDAQVAQALLKKPFDHIFFTGSTRVGKLVMKAAAEHLSSVTLELGGKSPVVIDHTADLNDAVKKIAFGKYLNSGQTCIAPDYLLVHANVQEAFEQQLRQELSRMFGSKTSEQKQSPYARVINASHFQRLVAMLEEAKSRNSQVVFGGQIDAQDNFIAPTVVRLHLPDGKLMDEEIFGPILPIITFKHPSEVIEWINQLDKPLGLYIFSKNRSFIQQIVEATDSGAVCINDALLHYIHLNLPFGGVRSSGLGNSHGFYGFRAFSYERAMLKQGVLSPLKCVYPPYTDLKRKLIQWIVKFFS